MPKTIIVPLDGSATATHAVPTGSWLATRFGADLHLVSNPLADDDEAAAVIEWATRIAKTALVHHEVLAGSVPSSGILAAAEAAPEAVICLSSNGHGALGEMLLGQVSASVVRQARVPVVLIGPRCRDVLDDPQDMVLCLAEPAEGELMLPLANRWASDLGLRLHVVQALGPGVEPLSERTLFHAGGAAPDVGLTIDVRDPMSPGEVAVGLARGLDACLTMVATDGRNRLLEDHSDHVATEIIRNSHCPVVVRHLAH